MAVFLFFVYDTYVVNVILDLRQSAILQNFYFSSVNPKVIYIDEKNVNNLDLQIVRNNNLSINFSQNDCVAGCMADWSDHYSGQRVDSLARFVVLRHRDARVGGSVPGLGSFNTVTLAPNNGSPYR